MIVAEPEAKVVLINQNSFLAEIKTGNATNRALTIVAYLWAMNQFPNFFLIQLEFLQYQALRDRYPSLENATLEFVDDTLLIDCHHPAMPLAHGYVTVDAIAEDPTFIKAVYCLTGRTEIQVYFADELVCQARYQLSSSPIVKSQPMSVIAPEKPTVAAPVAEVPASDPHPIPVPEVEQLCSIEDLADEIVSITGQKPESIRSSIRLLSPKLFQLGNQEYVTTGCVKPIMNRWAEAQSGEIEARLHAKASTAPAVETPANGHAAKTKSASAPASKAKSTKSAAKKVKSDPTEPVEAEA